MDGAYYNEIDPYAAEWLRNLIADGHIAPGDVDTRSIEDVRPDDLRGYAQCHFFAGIGVWSYALRRAGWSDDREVWTGSCPCQPFSAAGKGAGFADERHLWPAFYHLITERRPAIVLGEQVASAAVDDWIDLVYADLEALGYAFGSVPFPSAGVGAPHIRDRNYWAGILANADDARLEGRGRMRQRSTQLATGASGVACGLADANNAGRQLLASAEPAGVQHEAVGAQGGVHELGTDRASLGSRRPSPTNGFWRDADWLGCRDGKWRPVEPGTFPLADGAAARVGRLRAYGNAINAEAARAFIEVVMECRP